MEKEILHNDIFLVKNFLSEKKCNEFIKEGEEKGFEDAKISIYGKQVLMKNVRNNERVMYKDYDLADMLWRKIKQFVPETYGKYKATGINEMFRIYKYTKGQTFKMHKDGSYQRNPKECSFFSFLIYLNDDFKGGETYFENGINIIPKKGNALLFYHPLRHEGKEIISGTKYVLRTDIMYTL